MFGFHIFHLINVSLVGEASGKASKSLTKHIPGTGNISYLQQQAGASGSEFSRTRLVSILKRKADSWELFFFIGVLVEERR